jgi:hypothetical protein
MNYSHLSFHNRLEVGQEAWDSFVKASDEAWLWHRFDFQDAISTWPGMHDLSFAIRDAGSDGRIVAILPLRLIESRRMNALRWKILDSLGGPACANDLGIRQKRKILEYTISQGIALARKYNAIEVNFSLSPVAPAYSGECCPRVNPLLELGCENTLTQTLVIDLMQGRDSVWENMENRARTAIRKAEKQGLSIRAGKGPEDLEIYYNLHCETYSRTGVPPHPKSYFEAIWRNFLQKGLSYILFAVWNDTVVAAENFGVFKKAGIYWTGGANNQGLLFQANSLLQWDAMQWMMENGVVRYEIGEAFPHLREGKLKGLDAFKRSFGGELFPYYRGRIVVRPFWKSLWNFYRTFKTIYD